MSTIDAISEPVCRRTEDSERARRPRQSFFQSSWRWFAGLPARRMTRRGLLELTDEQLRDIGISRAEAHRWNLRSFRD